jgi:hypothetical protein
MKRNWKPRQVRQHSDWQADCDSSPGSYWIFLFASTSRWTLQVSTSCPSNGYWSETDQSRPSEAEVKNVRRYMLLPLCVTCSFHDAWLSTGISFFFFSFSLCGATDRCGPKPPVLRVSESYLQTLFILLGGSPVARLLPIWDSISTGGTQTSVPRVGFELTIPRI